ncbi:MAG: [protein-PII] uridylyltransferase [Gordonia sp. (in: high G+C Gram-positive bacteria)]|uniref:[protein-PII] uridylyltransferase n=1 Tax=Gordonia sp. (in: high G+C Gram-positive bacteria) TaxID=84139 RepID=UPI0039E2528D
MNAAPKLSDSGPGISGPAKDLAAARAGVLAEFSPDRPAGQEFRDRLTEAYEGWLTQRADELGITQGSGFAIVAVGALGRGETVAGSDLDLMLVHDDRFPDQLADKADGLWYPIWDSGVGLDHSVRTIPEALRVARSEATATLSLLDARYIAGDQDLASLLIASVRNLWRVEARTRLPEILDAARARWDRAGEIAQRAEPDLKNGRGGLRDVQLLNALALAQLTDGMSRFGPDGPGSEVGAAYQRLLDVRTQQHLIARRARDRVQAQDADQLAAALGLGDRFDLAREVSRSARITRFAVDTGVRTARHSVGKKGLTSRLRRLPGRRPLDEGVVEYDGEVVLARSVIPSQDAGLALRVAAASATNDLPINAGVLDRLAKYSPEIPEPWSPDTLGDLLVLLAAGRTTAPTVEALNQIGLWTRLFPEWEVIEDLPPRDAVHEWTVDRHLLETTMNAAALTTSVSRPDLLLIGALLHDIGKGRDGDHSEVGEQLARDIGTRMGLWPQDVDTLAAMVRHHLLLPEIATRRDPSDPGVVASVATTLDHDRVLVELLGALTEADSLATGPGVWSDWKATLVSRLVRNTLDLIGGDEIAPPEPLSVEQEGLAASGGVHVRLETGDGPSTYRATMVAPDTPGLLSQMAGVIALAGLATHDAQVRSHAGSAINTFVVEPAFGGPPDVQVLQQQLRAAVEGRLDVPAKLVARDSAKGEARTAVAPPKARWIDDSASGSLLLEVRAADRPGLLARITSVLERAGADVRWAKVATLGSTVVDTFCVELARDTDGARAELIDAVLRVCPGAAPGGGSPSH